MDKLNPNEIKKQIDLYNKQIEDCFYPNQFTLNGEIKKINEAIKNLQNQCPHEYENGYCKYCYKSEGEN